jgi:hypothetical protein
MIVFQYLMIFQQAKYHMSIDASIFKIQGESHVFDVNDLMK